MWLLNSVALLLLQTPRLASATITYCSAYSTEPYEVAPSSCSPLCTTLQPGGLSLKWTTYLRTYTSYITYATQVAIINKQTNSTLTTTIYDPEVTTTPAKTYTKYSNITWTAYINGSLTTYTTLAYPTVLMDLPKSIGIQGRFPSAINGSDGCFQGPDPTAVTFLPLTYPASVYTFTTQAPDALDPLGWGHDLDSSDNCSPFAVTPLTQILPDYYPLKYCTAIPTCQYCDGQAPATAQQIASYLLATSTSYIARQTGASIEPVPAPAPVPATIPAPATASGPATAATPAPAVSPEATSAPTTPTAASNTVDAPGTPPDQTANGVSGTVSSDIASPMVSPSAVGAVPSSISSVSDSEVPNMPFTSIATSEAPSSSQSASPPTLSAPEIPLPGTSSSDTLVPDTIQTNTMQSGLNTEGGGIQSGTSYSSQATAPLESSSSTDSPAASAQSNSGALNSAPSDQTPASGSPNTVDSALSPSEYSLISDLTSASNTPTAPGTGYPTNSELGTIFDPSATTQPTGGPTNNIITASGNLGTSSSSRVPVLQSTGRADALQPGHMPHIAAVLPVIVLVQLF